jgi:hypothetical protein
MWLSCLNPFVVLEEEWIYESRLAELENGPWNRRRDGTGLVLARKAQRRLYTQGTRDIWVVHQFILFCCEIAVDGQSPVHFVYKS